jgi:proton-coupled amino acid transporter
MTAIPSYTQKTTAWQAFISLLKGYVGPGCLSLPWAISQLGLPFGILTVFGVSYWTSTNVWHIVLLKRDYERTLSSPNNNNNVNNNVNNNITYPQVGTWLYGKRFGQFLAFMICVQQLSVCTVFLSFIGENLSAVIRHTLWGNVSHTLVISMVLPAAMGLACLPTVKVLAPVMALATTTLFAGFAFLFYLILEDWKDRPQDPPISIQDFSQLPLAICAILYSFEGICLILPIETSMQHPEQFVWVFVSAMSISAIIFALVAASSVLSFGPIDSGSITAFLVEHNGDNDNGLNVLYAANTLVSVAVLLTYPLQLFPSYELVGPVVAKHFTTNCTSETHGAYVAASSIEQEQNTIPQEAPFCDEEETRSSERVRIPQLPSRDSQDSGVDSQTNHNNDNHQKDYWNYFGTSYGDTLFVRAGLVLITYFFAIIVPDVQLLVSLVGAVSGSTTCLLVPPLLQLQYWKTLERQEENTWRPWYYQRQRLKCYFLLIMGSIVLVIGTGASLRDIIRTYNQGNAQDETRNRAVI